MKFLKRCLRIFLSAVLLFACCFSFASCDLDPSEFEIWYIQSYRVGENVYNEGSIYGTDVVRRTSITAKFADGRVTLNIFGEERQGDYRYVGSNCITKAKSKLTITFDDGERYEGNCSYMVFDGRLDELTFSNGEESFQFSPNLLFSSEDPGISLFEYKRLPTECFEYLDSKAYLTDGAEMDCSIKRGTEKEFSITDVAVIEEFLTLGKEETLENYDYSRYYTDAYKGKYCAYYDFWFSFKDATGKSLATWEFGFYYDEKIDFYFVKQYNFSEVGISAQKDSVFAYLVSLLGESPRG